MGFPGDSEGKASAYNAGDPGSIPGSGRSPGEGNGNPLQYSCLENPMVIFVPANWNTDHFCVPVYASLFQKCSINSQANPKCHAISGFPPHPNTVDYVAPANQIFSIVLFPVLYSHTIEAFLPSDWFCSFQNGGCLLPEVLNKVCL